MIADTSQPSLKFRTVLPPVGRNPDLRALADQLGGKLVLGSTTPAGTIEQYRRLAATLHHAQRENGIKVVMVASAMPGEGKTLTASNLALTLSESFRRKVLVIDADLRRPTMHDIFQIPNIAGLNEALASDDVLPPAFELSHRLTLLPAGRPNPDPIGVLTSPAMRDLIRDARADFEWVIVDTPPIGLLTDASLLAGMVDAVLMVVAAGGVPVRTIQRAADALGRDRIMGVVLNRAQLPAAGKYGHQGYGGYYGHHGYYGGGAASR